MKRSDTDEAISLAMQGRWEEVVAINENILKLSPNDVQAHNRLGKALIELRRYPEAREIYESVLTLDPNNNIAKRNLLRLSYLKDEGQSPKEARYINSKFFIEETSKARMTILNKPAPRETLAKMSAGDYAHLQIMEHRLAVVNDSGEYLGEIEPRIGWRLIDRIKGGNEYQAAIISLRDDDVRVLIRETFNNPSQEGQPAFPPRAADELKPYLKDTIVKYELDEELPTGPEEPGDLEGEEEPAWQDDISDETEEPISIEEEVDEET